MDPADTLRRLANQVERRDDKITRLEEELRTLRLANAQLSMRLQLAQRESEGLRKALSTR